MAEEYFKVDKMLEEGRKDVSHMRQYPFTTQDTGGPREKKAHEDNAEFIVMVRSDGYGGYWYNDLRNEARVPGRRTDKSGRPVKPQTLSLWLREHDSGAAVLETEDKGLLIIKRERELIKFFRGLGHDDPIKSADARLSLEEDVWDEAVEKGIKPWDYLDAKISGDDPSAYTKGKTYEGESLRELKAPRPPAVTVVMSETETKGRGKGK